MTDKICMGLLVGLMTFSAILYLATIIGMVLQIGFGIQTRGILG